MKNIKFMLVAAGLFVAGTTFAQDLSAPQYAKWGETVQERETNLLNSNFLKEEVNNRNYNMAATHFKHLIDKCPAASANTYAYGEMIYKGKIGAAKTLEEKNTMIDSLMLVYDLRIKYFGDHSSKGEAYILDRKARAYTTYKSTDREGMREVCKAAITAAGDAAEPDLVTLYFKNLCDDFKNDEVMADEIIAEYDRLTPIFEKSTSPTAADFKTQFDACFGFSGAASCENLETLFKKKLAAAPNDETTLSQAVNLMERAQCSGAFYLATAEKLYAVRPSSNSAMKLAQVFQNEGNYDKSLKYLREALAVETNADERESLYVKIALVELVANRTGAAAEAARQAININADNGLAYFVLAQCYASGAGACAGIGGQAVYWAAYDTMQQAIQLLSNSKEADAASYVKNAQSSANAYRYRFPTAEECFFNELAEGSRYKVACGPAAGVTTTVRFR